MVTTRFRSGRKERKCALGSDAAVLCGVDSRLVRD
jgi:hypothetical protein